MPEEIATEPVKLMKNGDITQDIDGQKTVVAHYDRKTRHLEFATMEGANKLTRLVTAAIGTVAKGTQSSGLTIETMSVKGQERDKPAGKVPPRPRRDANLGDQTPDLVSWYFKYYPHEAYIRYGVFLDDDGEPRRARVKRLTKEIVDDREGNRGLAEQNEGRGAQVGPKTFEGGPIQQMAELEFKDDQIIARRATHMTFQPHEVVGGFDTGEDESGEPREPRDDDGGDA